MAVNAAMNVTFPVVFAHGLEGSPDGTKGTYLRELFGAIVPELGQLDIMGQVDALEDVLPLSSPSVVVGSSCGGLAALGLANRCPDRIAHLVLLAPAIGMERHRDENPEVEKRRPGIFDQAAGFSILSIPPSMRATVIHGNRDPLVARDDVLELVKRSPSAGMVLVDDDHSLLSSKDIIISFVKRAAAGEDLLSGSWVESFDTP